MASTKEYKDFDSESKMIVHSVIEDIVEMAIIRATIVPGEYYKNFSEKFMLEKNKLIDKFIIPAIENEYETKKLKSAFQRYFDKHRNANVTNLKDPYIDTDTGLNLSEIANNIRNRWDHIKKNPKFFEWLIEKGFKLHNFKGKENEKRIKDIRSIHSKINIDKKKYYEERYDKFYHISDEYKDDIETLISNQQKEFDNYIDECSACVDIKTHPIYGPEKPERLNKFGDANLVYFSTELGNNNGKKMIFQYEKFIQRDGGIYTILKNGEKSKISYGSKKQQLVALQIQIKGCDKTIQRNIHLLRMMSYYPHLNWEPFCKCNIKSQGKGTMEIDHITQNHSNCHYVFLEVVPNYENAYRSSRFSKNNKERRKQAGITTGKSMNIIQHGTVVKQVENAREASEYLKSNLEIDISSIDIPLIANDKLDSRPGLRKLKDNGNFDIKYTDEYQKSQEDLAGEIWRFNPKYEHDPQVLLWIQRFNNNNTKLYKTMILQEWFHCGMKRKFSCKILTWKQHKHKILIKSKLIAISNKGRVWTKNYGKKYTEPKSNDEIVIIEEVIREKGKRPKKLHSYAGSDDGAVLVHLAWSHKKISKDEYRWVLHKNGDEYLRNNKHGQIINVYNNEFESLYIGSPEENSRDQIIDEIEWYKKFPEEEFLIFDPIGVNIGKFHSVMEFAHSINEQAASWSHLYAVLNGERRHCKGYTIKHVISRPNMPIHLYVGKKVIDIKTKKKCIIQKFTNNSTIVIELCDSNEITRRWAPIKNIGKELNIRNGSRIIREAFKDIEE